MKNKYLIIGSAPTEDPSTHGGTTLLVKQLLEYFDENEKNYIFIQAMKYTGKFSFIKNYLYVVMQTLKHISKADIVMVNVANNGAYYLAPFILFISRIFKKKFVFRRFAGGFLEIYKKTKGIKRKLIDYVIKYSDIMFFEPKYLVEHYSSIRDSVYWFPNARKRAVFTRDKDRPYQKKFVFLGQIRKEKGIDEILESSKHLSDEYSIDLYGSLFDEKYNKILFEKYPNVSYKGLIHNDKVYEVLAQYDVLLLPSYMEGYPGVLIEAFSVGLPVISTNLPSIVEMVDGKNGILIEPKRSEELLEAITSVNESKFSKFSKHALHRFNDFEYESVYEKIINICENIK